jgi:hypothetical protein
MRPKSGAAIRGSNLAGPHAAGDVEGDSRDLATSWILPALGGFVTAQKPAPTAPPQHDTIRYDMMMSATLRVPRQVPLGA